jgi:PAS domain S-box-containing protein
MDTMSSEAAALRLSEERFRVVAEALQDHGVIMIDRDGRIQTWNQGAMRTFGYRADEAIGQHIRLLEVPEARAAGIGEAELEHAEAEGSAANDRWLMRRSGEAFYANGTTTAMRAEDGSLLGFCKIVRDRTEQRRLEENLRSQRDRLEFAQDVGRIGTFEWNIVTGEELWTEGMYHLYGIPQGTFKGTYRDWITMVHPDDVRPVEMALSEAIAYRRPVAVEFRAQLPEGGYRWLALAGRAVYEDGQPLRLVGTQVDIDARKRAEDEMSQANRELQQFAQVASHDLQEPLRMITSYLGLIVHTYADSLDARARGYIRYASDGARRLQELIASLLKFASYERDTLRLERVPSQHLFAQAVAHLKARIHEAGAVIEHGELPEIVCDREHAVRLFQNLIANALKYRREGVPPRVRVDARREGERWVFTVADNGQGIAEEHRQRIFELFQRLHGREVAGTGIGLAVCKKIVERHGGRIWVDSVVGEGSTFCFTLPA